MKIKDKRSQAMMFAILEANPGTGAQRFEDLVAVYFHGDPASLQAFLFDLDKVGLKVVKS